MLLNVPRAERVMDRHGLDGLIGTTPENVRYISGVDNSGFLINRYKTQVFAIVSRAQAADPVLVTGLGDVSAIYQLCPPDFRAIHYGSFVRYVSPDADLNELEKRVKDRVVDRAASNPPSAFEGLLAGLGEAGLTHSRVGYDEKGFDPAHLPGLKNKLPDLELVPAWEAIREVRAVKTVEEIRRLTASLRLTERGIQAAVAVAKPSCTEEDLIREFRREVAVGGGTPVANEITFTRRAAIGSLPVQDGILKEGDLIRFDIGCKVDGYCSDIARLFAFRGDLQPRIHKIYEAMKAGEEQAMQIMKPGITAGEVFERTVQAVREAGVPHYARTHVGHAIGLEVYEVPLLGPGDPTPLEAGMVFEVETPYYEIGFAGIQIEDTVVVRGNGVEMITELPRGIEQVG